MLIGHQVGDRATAVRDRCVVGQVTQPRCYADQALLHQIFGVDTGWRHHDSEPQQTCRLRTGEAIEAIIERQVDPSLRPRPLNEQRGEKVAHHGPEFETAR